MRCFSVSPYVAAVVSSRSILSSHWSLLYSRCDGCDLVARPQVTAVVSTIEVMFPICDTLSAVKLQGDWAVLCFRVILILQVGGPDGRANKSLAL
jgi:hypothetical protein